MEASARPPRDTAAVLRWGAPLIYLAAIGLLYINNSPAITFLSWQWVLQLVLLPLVIAAIVLRVRFPHALPLLGIAAIAAGTFSVFIVGMMSLAVRRGGARTWLMAAAGSAAAAILISQRDADLGYTPGEIVFGVAMVVVIVGLAPTLVGGYMRAHRRLAASVAERAVRAEFERELAARQAVHTERERIAREMHDSLGHVLALVTMQAGALEVRSTDPDTVAAAEQIRASARTGLADLRAVVRALGEDARRDPAPDLAAVPRLVEASRAAGATVGFRDELSASDRTELSPAIGRVLYQVTQEALTNAHRHAPGAPVDIVLTGAPGEGVRLEVGNPLAPGGDRGAGTGLAALRGRVEVLGGRLDAHAAQGRYELSVHLPWEAA
ncbi:sensor histidine kinase [Microbacterium sp.]|uniref:sensor histidine kinase n=1 Tax=Microbacterium sp. TaxID=51671 RepID=UPI0039E42031